MIHFMDEPIVRLEKFLSSRIKYRNAVITPLTPDASTRDYFRIVFGENSAIACIYPEPFLPAEQSYLDTTRLFQEGGLPVAKIVEFDGTGGIIIQEDFGDRILRDVLESADARFRESLIDQAISLIAKIQAATKLAFEMNSVASRLKFDKEKLVWELNFFREHYFESFLKRKPEPEIYGALNKEFDDLAARLEKRGNVLCHRDYHAANLMVTSDDRLCIIDHQDARIGSAAYDLVSLLLDRVLQPPSDEWIEEKIRYFLDEREKIGLERLEFHDFSREFDLMTVQRCLKAIGTFSNQTANCGKTNYVQFIKPMFRIVLKACTRLGEFPALTEVINGELE